MTKRKNNPVICKPLFRLSHYSICLFPDTDSLKECVTDYISTLLSRRITPFLPLPPPPMLHAGLLQSPIQCISICKLKTLMIVVVPTIPYLYQNRSQRDRILSPKSWRSPTVLVILELHRDPSCLLSCYI